MHELVETRLIKIFAKLYESGVHEGNRTYSTIHDWTIEDAIEAVRKLDLVQRPIHP